MKLFASVVILASIFAAPTAKSQTLADLVVLESQKAAQLQAESDACDVESDRLGHQADSAFQAAYAAAKDEAERDKVLSTESDLQRAFQEKLLECASLSTTYLDGMVALLQICNEYVLSAVTSKAPTRAADLVAIDACNKLDDSR